MEEVGQGPEIHVPLRSYQDLTDWQKAKDLAVAVYRATEKFPKSEQWGLASQMRSAAVSVASNIAEGYGRRNRREYVQFLGVANGSLKELETQIIIAREIGILPEAAGLLARCDEAGRILGGLIRSLTKCPRHPTPFSDPTPNTRHPFPTPHPAP